MKKKTVALITSVAATMLLSITANAEDNAAEGEYVAQVNSGEKYTSL